MIRHRYRWLIDMLCISALLGVSASSCSKQEEPDVFPLLSDTEITLSLPEWTPMVQSRATLFEEKGDLKNVEKGRGNFTLYAYVDATATKYIDGVRTWYFDDPDDSDNSEWMMLDGNERPITYYWPNSEKLNFFAFMPYNNNDDDMSKKTHVKVLDYSKENGGQFECALPGSASDATEIQEFIYAYESGKTKQGQYNSETKQYDPLTLRFKHPFALINFKLKGGSYRMTVHNIKFSDIHLNGTFSTKPEPNGKWKYTGGAGEYTALIEKRIPNDINYNTNLSDWFIVMPQDLNGVRLTLSATRAADKTNLTETAIEKTFTFSNSEGKEWKWEAGKKYTYVISYGDNQEEIYFNVEVEEDWKLGYEHNIDVE
ncbi:fimbrillin family protein [Bacteroides sp. AN502(2024)]|uniref:fimbrillin family protein n=1 Tax=Bacteroides sp. AN502(2024) TaxID=3160599 RepID=UPI003516886A